MNMDITRIIGYVLIAVGALDLLLAWLVVGPRAPEASRRVVVAGMSAGGILLVAAGAALLAGLFPGS